MMSMTTAALPASNAYEHSSADSSAGADAAMRARPGPNDAGNSSGSDNSSTAGSAASSNLAQTQANDAARTAAIAKLSQPDTSIPDPVQMISTLAVVNASLGSAPATLAMMSDIAVASGSGTLSDADRSALQTQYAQLSQQFTATVGAASAGAQTSSSDQDSRDADAGANSQSSDDRRTTLTRTSDAPPQYVQHEPLEQLVTTTKMVQVQDDSAPRTTPVVSLLRHELHVGTDSYEPVAVKQTMTRASRPAQFAQVEQQSTTHRVAVAQVTQIRQLTEVAQVQLVSVVA
jgi:hypothetical protein